MLKVVVVEDEELVRKGIVLAVDWASVGCAVVGEAANGQEGLEVIARYRPDLIVTDIKMPRLDGLEMVRQLRAQGNRAYVILLTAYSDFSYAQAAVKLGRWTICSSPSATGSWRPSSSVSSAGSGRSGIRRPLPVPRSSGAKANMLWRPSTTSPSTTTTRRLG